MVSEHPGAAGHPDCRIAASKRHDSGQSGTDPSSNPLMPRGHTMFKTIAKSAAILFAVLLVTLLVLSLIGMWHLPGDGMILHSDGFPHDAWWGNALGALIAGFVLVLVGGILTVVFAGVGLLLLLVGILVAAVLLLVAMPVLLPVLAVIAVPFLILYGLVRLAVGDRPPAAS